MHYMNAATHANLLNESSIIKPWRTTGMPILITERPPSLYCSIKQINQMHHTCIKNYDLKRMNPKKQYVYRLKEGGDGLLKIEFKGKRAVEQYSEEVRERRKRERDDDVGEREGEVRAEAQVDEGRRR